MSKPCPRCRWGEAPTPLQRLLNVEFTNEDFFEPDDWMGQKLGCVSCFALRMAILRFDRYLHSLGKISEIITLELCSLPGQAFSQI